MSPSVVRVRNAVPGTASSVPREPFAGRYHTEPEQYQRQQGKDDGPPHNVTEAESTPLPHNPCRTGAGALAGRC